MYIVYKTTNKVNKKFYIGVHRLNSTANYLGSGILLKRAIAKHGIENFYRETLYTFNTPEEAYNKEREIVTELLVNNDHCYNLKEGGIGGAGSRSTETKQKISQSMKQLKSSGDWSHTEETKQKIKQMRKLQTFSEETKQKISQSMTGDKNHYFGKTHSPEIRSKMKAAATSRPKVECPHCHKLVDKSTSMRWHFNNCKLVNAST